jgi:hypothetical protein
MPPHQLGIEIGIGLAAAVPRKSAFMPLRWIACAKCRLPVIERHGAAERAAQQTA